MGKRRERRQPTQEGPDDRGATAGGDEKQEEGGGWRAGRKQRAAERKFERSPGGRARAAADHGDSIFEYYAEVRAKGNGDVLSAIEAEGRTLQDTEHVLESQAHTDSDGRQSARTTPHVLYRFRR